MENRLRTSYQRVAWILEHIPAAQSNYKLLMLLYWQIFDGIDIPKEVVNQIIEKATEPETINRAKRKVIETMNFIEDIELNIKEAIKSGKGNNKSENR